MNFARNQVEAVEMDEEEEEEEQHPELAESQSNGIRLDNWNGHLAVNV